jgi:general secretion pathway protein L
MILHLNRDQVLSTQIELPARSALDLRSAVQADLDRFTPFSTEDIYFDAQIIAVDNANDRIKVILQVAQIADVERAVELARTVGLQPTRVTGERRTDAPDLNLLPVARRYRPRRLLPKAVKAMATLLICAAALHSAIVYLRKQEALTESQAYIRKLRTTAVAASEMEDRLTEFQAAVAWIEDAKIGHPSTLGGLAAITRALPDQSFLVGFEMLDGTFSLSGFSSDPTGMLLRLEEDDRLQNARFTAPTTWDARTGLNRFLAEVEFMGESK